VVITNLVYMVAALAMVALVLLLAVTVHWTALLCSRENNFQQFLVEVFAPKEYHQLTMNSFYHVYLQT